MWTLIAGIAGRVAVPLLTTLVGGIFSAENRLGPKCGKEKSKLAEDIVQPLIESFSTSGEIAMPAEKAVEYVRDIIKGVVAFFNLLGIFKRS